jgi:hypothetical protein
MSFDYKRLVKFEHNLGAKDKKVRLYSGIVLLSVSLFTASVLMLLVGLVLVGTAYSGWCPAYSGLDKNSLDQDHTAEVADVAADADGQ